MHGDCNVKRSMISVGIVPRDVEIAEAAAAG
jgi:hypothetical protein